MKPEGTECGCRVPVAGCGGGEAGGGGWRGAAVACGLTKQLDADKPRTQYDKLKC